MTPSKLLVQFCCGHCRFYHMNKKYILNLLGKGIGWRNLRIHLMPWTSALETVIGVSHFAFIMLHQLILCKFNSSGLVALSKLLLGYFLFFSIFASSNGASVGQIEYDVNGKSIYCNVVTCRKGYEVVPCVVTGGTDTCRVCHADKYQAQDNITSHFRLRCYSVNCAPDNQRAVQHGSASASNPPVCECDTERGYYQAGEQAENCEKKICPKNEKLTLRGKCDCKDGRMRNEADQCVWPLPVPPVQNDLTSSTSTPAIISSTTKEAPSYTTTKSMTSTPVSEIKTDMDKSSGSGVVTSPATSIEETTKQGKTPNAVTSNSDGSMILVLIVVFAALVVIVALFILTYLWKKRHERSDGGSDEERTRLDKPSGSAPQMVIINAQNAQVGNGNVMQRRMDAEVSNSEDSDF